MQHETSVLFAVIKGGPYRHALLLGTLLTLLLPTRGPAADVKVGNQTFTLPDGLTVECVAAPPLVDRPITMAIGDDGALYVADSSGSNDPVEKQLKDKPHRILRLIDTDDDGDLRRTHHLRRPHDVSLRARYGWMDRSMSPHRRKSGN